MSIAVTVSLAEYLDTSYRPDCEYLDGVVVERNLGERDHSWLQGKLLVLLSRYEEPLGLFTFPEQRVQVKKTRFRVPDLCVTRGFPDEKIITAPPFLCLEVLSPKDSLASMRDRMDDYLEFGVENIWLVDPSTKRAYWADRAGVHSFEGDILEAKGAPIRLDLGTVWPR